MRTIRSILGSASALMVALWLLTASASGAHRAAVSRDLADHVARHASDRVRVIVHGDAATIARLAARHGLRVIRQLDHEGVLEANGAELDALGQDVEIDHLSGDLPVRGGMTISNQATGADQVWKKFSGLPGVTGAGVTVAVIDSGIKAHAALKNKVKANVSWVWGGSTDAYGHGTHLAGIIAGDGAVATKVTPLYNGGIAPGASLINLHVLSGDGSGLTSDVIAAIDWAVTNRVKYHIRIINLSLGHPITEPSYTDPLCEAVARAYRAGLVVVASAGNYGKTATGEPVLGGIVSPGNSPYAITVGALSTRATGDRTDDVVTTYSSRGPTRFDLRIKPDVVAPGNKIISLEADGSYLDTTYPSEHVAGSGTNGYFRMSGTSMATAMVSGAVALLLEANPNLDPRQVRLALQMGATYLPEAGLVGGGAGSVDLLASRYIASKGLTDPIPGGTIAGAPVTPGGLAFWGATLEALYSGTHIRIIGSNDALWANSTSDRIIWGDVVLWANSTSDRIIWGDLSLLANSTSDRIIWGDVVLWANSTSDRIIWGDLSLLANSTSDRIIWGDSLTSSSGDRIIWGDSLQSLTIDPNRIIWGDGGHLPGDP